MSLFLQDCTHLRWTSVHFSVILNLVLCYDFHKEITVREQIPYFKCHYGYRTCETKSVAPHENLKGAKLLFMQIILRYVLCREVLKYLISSNQA